uniref:Uncharacterized protein n=1 Tax=Piliocolobus tephrosceles TaxID=591936 RepID=A0A8C9IF95_9PRIM
MYTHCTGVETHCMYKNILTVGDPESPVYHLTSQLPASSQFFPKGLQVFRTLQFRAKCS